MTIFLTAYCIGGASYGEHLEARNLRHAEALAIARGLNEHIQGEQDGPSKLSNNLAALLRDGEWLRAAHAAAQLCFVGMAAGALTARECLGDTGLVHDLLHLALNVDKDEPRDHNARIRRVKATAKEFEWRVPGWPPSFRGKPGVETYINDRKQKD